jgi:hypothetical protein
MLPQSKILRSSKAIPTQAEIRQYGDDRFNNVICQGRAVVCPNNTFTSLLPEHDWNAVGVPHFLEATDQSVTM